MFYAMPLSVVAAATQVAFVQPTATPQLDRLMLFGFLSALVTLGCLPQVRRARGARLLLTMSLTAQTVYGFLCGAWPLGIVALVGSCMAARWWWRSRLDIELALSAPKRSGRYGLAITANMSAPRRAGPVHGDECHFDEN